MRTLIPFLLVAGSAQAVCVLSMSTPANNTVVTYGTQMSVSAAGCTPTNASQVRYFFDHRLEAIVNASPGNPTFSSPILNQTYSDYKSAQIYAVAYDALGNAMATSSAVTIRIDNQGINADATFTDGTTTKVRGDTITTGILVPTAVRNATVSGLNDLWLLDGLSPTDSPYTTYCNTDSSHLTLSGGGALQNTCILPFVPFPSGTRIWIQCRYLSKDPCGNINDVPAPLQSLNNGGSYYASIGTDGSGHVTLGWATSKANALSGTLISITARPSTTNAYVEIVAADGALWHDNATGNLDLTYFPDGEHIVEHVLQGTGNGPAGTFSIVTANVNCANAHIATTNVPLAPGEALSFSASQCAAAIAASTTYYAAILDANTWCPATTANNALAGICITTSTGTGQNATISFTVPETFFNSGYGNQSFGTQNDWFTLSSGTVPMSLELKTDHVYVTNGETFSLAPQVRNCDGSVTSIAANSVLYGSADTSIFTVSTSGVVTGGSTNGNAYLTVVDDVHHRSRLIIVTTLANHTDFPHFALGGALRNTYLTGTSKWLVTSFQLLYGYLASPPYPFPWWKASGMTAAYGGENSSWTSSSYGCYSSGCVTGTPWLTAWQAAWNGSNFESKAWADLLYSTYGKNYMQFYWTDVNTIEPPLMVDLWNTTWKQQALSKMMNDLTSHTIGGEAGDEMNGIIGGFPQPAGTMGSTTKGVQNTVGGLSQVVISGCPGSCLGTATWSSFNGFGLPGNCSISGSVAAGANGTCGGITAGTTQYNHRLGAYFDSATFTLSGGTNGTYNATGVGGTADAGFTINQPLAITTSGTHVAQDWMDRLYGCGSNSWLTGTKPPLSANLQAGGSTAGSGANFERAAAYGWNCTAYATLNSSPGVWDRFGDIYRNYLKLITDQIYVPLVDGSVLGNYWFGKPILPQSVIIGNTCIKNLLTDIPCRTDLPSADTYYQLGETGKTSFVSNIIPIMLGAAGQKQYGAYGSVGNQKAPPVTPTVPYYSGPDWNDQYTDNYLGGAASSLFGQQEDELVLSPLMDCPDSGKFGLTILSICHKAASGKYGMVLFNIGGNDLSITVDVSTLKQGGPARTWVLSPFGDTVSSQSSSATSFSITIRSGEGWAYLSQASGSTDELMPFAPVIDPTTVTGGTKAVVQVSYYPKSYQYQSFDCSTGACPSIPVLNHNLNSYYRVIKTDNSGNVKAASEVLPVLNQ